MQEISSERPALSLLQLNGLIKSAIADTLPDQYWVVAEIADLKLNQRGHCYLDLVEKEGNAAVAQIKANIWAYEYRSISNRFQKAANEPLKQGMKILFLASILFHEVYGLSLNVKDIDPTYTMGEMARKKKEVIARLRKEGIIDRNKAHVLPLVPQRIAVISSPTAAGYQDFFNHLDNNPYGYRFFHTLFPALMQGQEAEGSIIKALSSIRKQKSAFDLAVIIRGGGSVTDLNCFDGYPLAAEVAGFPLPVITGIGHEKDDTVVDIAAHTKLKTPTAVAEFLISGIRSFEENVLELESRIIASSELLLREEKQKLTSFAQRLSFVPIRLTTVHRNRLFILQREVQGSMQQRMQNEQNRLSRAEQAIRHLDPAHVLRRGYSITTLRGKILRDAALLKNGVAIETQLQNGTVTSIVQSGKEVTKSAKEQRTDLLPGFEGA
ncbi:MAG: exodeoxyribonuclease VII large subunit [Nitrospirae bacterium]|nr:exodeoxyribonuclease VII large subunit [Nitrospirota bacterium]